MSLLGSVAEEIGNATLRFRALGLDGQRDPCPVVYCVLCEEDLEITF
jgi:hypothetical protein